MKRSPIRAWTWMLVLSGLSFGLVPMACSTDGRGLGDLDAGRASGGRVGTGGGVVGSGSGGSGGSGASGAMTGSGSGGTVVPGTGGASPTETGGRTGTGSGGAAPGSGGTSTGGASTGGRTASGGAMSTGGAAVGGGGGRGGVGGTGTGGRVGTGGSATGGAATGGAGTGGRVGTGGAGTGGRVSTGGASGTQPDCTRDSDCHLLNDCCTCAALGPRQDPPPACALACLQSKCNAQGLPSNAVACVAGRCVAGFNCDDSNVTCRTAPPACPDGQVASVNAEGTCYAGGCVPAIQCTSVPSCNVCAAAQACVTNQSRGRNEHHCVTTPPGCNSANCSCLGDSVCVSPYTSCDNTSGGVKGVTCGCPTC